MGYTRDLPPESPDFGDVIPYPFSENTAMAKPQNPPPEGFRDDAALPILCRRRTLASAIPIPLKATS